MEIKKDKRLIVAQKRFGIDVSNWKNKYVFHEIDEMGPQHAHVGIYTGVPISSEHPKLGYGTYAFYFPFGQHGASSKGKKNKNKFFEGVKEKGKVEQGKPKPDMLRIFFNNLDVDSDGEGGGNHDYSTLTAEFIIANVADVEKEGEITIYYGSSKDRESTSLILFRREFGGDRDRDFYHYRYHLSPPWPFPASKSFLRKDVEVKPLPDTPDGVEETGAVYLRTGKKLNRYSLGAVVGINLGTSEIKPFMLGMLERKAIYKARGDQYNIAGYPPQIVNVFEERNIKYFLATVITPLIQKDKVKIEGRWYDKDGKYFMTEKSLIAVKVLKEGELAIFGELTGEGRIRETLRKSREEIVSTLSYSFKQEQVKNKTGYNIVDSLRQIFNLNLTEKETAIIGDKGIDGYDNSYFLYRSNLKKITYAGKPLLYSFKKE